MHLSLFGPYGNRLIQKLVYFIHEYSPGDGKYRRVDLPRPPSYSAWEKCWKVFECAPLLLKAVRPQRLKRYQEKIQKYAG